MEIANKIDHTLLNPTATKKEIEKLCNEAMHYGFASVCVNPFYVPYVAELLQNSIVKTCTVIGFPLGQTVTSVKCFEADWVTSNGCDEIDMVINVGALKDGDFDYVMSDIAAVVTTAKNNNSNCIVKVIIETCLLTDNEKVIATKLCEKANADFVKTSTGFSTGGATPEDIRILKSACEKMQVKASGGIKNYQDFYALQVAGADRFGTSRGVEIIESLECTVENNGKV